MDDVKNLDFLNQEDDLRAIGNNKELFTKLVALKKSFLKGLDTANKKHRLNIESQIFFIVKPNKE